MASQAAGVVWDLGAGPHQHLVDGYFSARLQVPVRTRNLAAPLGYRSRHLLAGVRGLAGAGSMRPIVVLGCGSPNGARAAAPS